MKSSHTLGPWEVGADGWIQAKSVLDPVMSVTMLAKVNNGIKANEANARLIAAAPELLEAARHALETVQDYIQDGANMETAKVLRAAIAKAEGGK